MIAVIDVAGNNLTSLGNALTRLGLTIRFTHCPNTIRQASHVVLPGVGTARAGMQALQAYQLTEVIKALTQPVLGICLGMQLLFDHSEEDGMDCLGIIPGVVRPLLPAPGYPVPNMGWDQLCWRQPSALQHGLTEADYFYFVHGFAVPVGAYTLASCQRLEPFSAVVQQDNFVGIQCHPEKSAGVGSQFLQNFFRGL